MKITNIKILLLIVFGVLLNFHSAFAGSLGLSPSEIKEEVVRGDIFEAKVVLLRSNPSENEYLDVSTSEDALGVMILTQKKLLLPVGEQQVPFYFTIDTSKLVGMDHFKSSVSFVKQETEANVGGASVLLGVTLQIDLRILSEPSLEMQAVDYTQLLNPALIYLTNLSEHLNKDRPKILFGIKNDSNMIVKNIPYRIEIFRNGQPISNTNLFTYGSIKPQEEKQWSVDSLETNLKTKDVVKVTLGNQVEGLQFIHRQSGSLKTYFHQSWLKIKRLSDKLILVRRFKDTENVSIFFPDGLFFLIKNSLNSDRVTHTNQSRQHELIGKWIYYAVSKNHVYAIPSKDTDTSQKNLFLFSNASIYPMDRTKLPGEITSVKEDSSEMYALFAGVRDDDKSDFYCLTELFIVNGPDCVFLDKIVAQKIQTINFSHEKQHQLILSTTDGFFFYDAWTKKLNESPVVEKIAEENLTENFDVLGNKASRPKIGFIRLDGSWYVTELDSFFYKIKENIYLQKIIALDKLNVFIVNTATGQRTMIVSLSSTDQFFLLKEGSFVTSP